MTRTPPAGAIPSLKPQANPNLITETRQYRLITQLFGGGVEPGVADPVTVVRASEIRGHLRFWWRATCGGQYDGDPKRMKDAEDAIWGTTSTPGRPGQSKVQVVVEVDPRQVRPAPGDLDAPFEVFTNANGRRQVSARRGSGTPAYAAFPLQPSQDELRSPRPPEPRTVRHNVAFGVRLSYPASLRPEVEAALWAWETFGGLGARTRRGFGAIHAEAIDGQPAPTPPLAEVARWLQQQLSRHVNGSVWPAGVPHLSNNMVANRVIWEPTGPGYGWWEPIEAWHYLIGGLQQFRQRRPQPRARSSWPEPDSIRLHVRRHSPGHEPRIRLGKYPRAVFGLPIVVHFKDARVGDPEDVTIIGRVGAESPVERLASPLVLRPILTRWQDQNLAVGIAAVLGGTAPPAGLALLRRGGRVSEPEPVNGAPLTPEEATQLGLDRVLLAGAVSGNTVDLLQVFLNYLERGG